MRKLIFPLLVAGVVAFTAGQAMATDAIATGAFSENHAYKSNYYTGTETATFSVGVGSGGNHYKKTDIIENGRHGGDFGGFQLRSSLLKSLATAEGTGFGAADGAWGYTSSANPFIAGSAGAPNGETDFPIVAPRYTMPCPEWVLDNATYGPGVDGAVTGNGDCPANAFATDPQTEDNLAVWDGTVLDDLYQTVGAVDNYSGAFDEDTGVRFGQGTTSGPMYLEEHRTYNQNLDQLFYNGKRGMVSFGITNNGGAFASRHFNIDDTLDQDVADWAVLYTGTNALSFPDETMGIYGKLTLLFQLAAPASSVEGCASGGAAEQADDGPSLCSPYAIAGNEGVNVGEGGGTAGFVADDFSAWIIDQWVVSDMWDWHHRSGDQDKEPGFGVQQGYSSWFRDGSGNDFNYTYNYAGGHGTIDKTFTTNSDHAHPDP